MPNVHLPMRATRLLLILFTLGLFAPLATPASAQEAAQLQVHSKRYIVIDADTGEVYAQKNAHQRVAIASLTKTFTAIEALESAPLDTKITTAQADIPPDAATRMGFGPGETFSLEDLLYGMLLPSGNDAARAIARSLGYQKGDTSPQQSLNRYVGWMNQRAKDIGLKDTHFVNPDGWGVKYHYSSAWDVAAWIRYAMHYPEFMKIIGTFSYTTANGAYTVTNTNKLMNEYNSLLGGKTGYDDDAGWCLIEIAKKNGHTMIGVTLDGQAPDDWYDDNRVLLEYGFQQKDSLLANGKSFSGDVVSFTDPGAAEIARDAQTGASAQGVAVAQAPPSRATTNGSPGLPNVEPVRDPSLGFKALGTASAVALIILLLQGGVTWRRRAGPRQQNRAAVDSTAGASLS